MDGGEEKWKEEERDKGRSRRRSGRRRREIRGGAGEVEGEG